MRLLLRTAGATVVSLFAAVVLTLFTVMPSAVAGNVLVVGGIGQPTVPDWVMSTILKGRFANDTRKDVEWPAEAAPTTKGTYSLGESVAIGTDNLLAEIAATSSPLTVVGMSGGALVTTEALRYYADNPDEAPDPADISFIVIADSSRQDFVNKASRDSSLGYEYQPAPEVPYDLTVITGEYDGFADFPDRWWNLLAVFNAYAGVLTQHIQTAYADLDAVPAENIEVEVNELGGVTTSYLVPAKSLPLTTLFPFLKDYEASLKKTIDKGYSRNDGKASAVAASSVAAPVEEPVAEEPVAEEPVAAEPVAAAKASAVAVTEDTESDSTTAKDEDEAVFADDEESDSGAAKDEEAALAEADEEAALAADEEAALAADEEAALAEAEEQAVSEDDEDAGKSAGEETSSDEADDADSAESSATESSSDASEGDSE